MSLTTILIYGTASLLPILGWLYFFQSQHKQKHKRVFLTFLAGCISVIPIKLYEKYWDIALWKFEHINLFQSISKLIHFPEFPNLVSFVLLNALVAFGLYLMSALMMFILEVLVTRDNTLRLYEKKTARILESPFIFISIGVICGILAYFFSHTVSQTVWFFAIVGMLEEFVKHLILRFSDEESINSVDDALSFAIVIALGFAFIENVIYMHDFMVQAGGNLGKIGIFFVLRSTISVLAHVCFSAILGYFYGVARFSEKIYQQETLRGQHKVIECIHMCLHLKGSVLFHEQQMVEGMLMAMILHAIFNSLLEFGYMNVVVGMLAVMFFYVLTLYHRKTFHEENGNFIPSHI